MKKILIISTGGTFNKVYNPKTGNLDIDKSSHAINEITSKWLCDFEVHNIIGKDSLDMTKNDRQVLLHTIQQSHHHNIIIVHGTDTMDITAQYLAEATTLKKCIVLTGAMVPYSIDPIEATANLASAYGYVTALEKDGVFIAMNGVIGSHEEVKKDRELGRLIHI